MAVDWTASMARTYEFYEVDPASWQDVRRLSGVLSATLTFDREQDTFGNGSFELSEDVGEAYIRAYAVPEQGGRREKMPVGTFLAQSSSTSFDGAARHFPAQAFTPLLELAENKPPIGYFVAAMRGSARNDAARELHDMLVRNCRAPVSAPTSGHFLAEDLVAELGESWLGVAKALAEKCGMWIAVDAYGRVSVRPERDPASMQPVQVFGESTHSVMGEVSVEHDMYGRCNVYEAVLTTSDGTVLRYAARNDNAASPLSIGRRGRTILERDESPEVPESMSASETMAHLESYAKGKLSSDTSAEYKVTFPHPWMPHVQVGSCVLLDFPGTLGIRSRAVVTSQSVACDTGGLATSTFAFTEVAA